MFVLNYEALDFGDLGVVRNLDVAVAGLGAGGADADGHQCFVLSREVDALGDHGAKSLLLQYEVIRWRNYHAGRGILFEKFVGCISNAGGCIAPYRLAEYLLGTQFGQVLKDHFAIADVCYHAKLLDGKEWEETLEGVPYQRLPGS